MIKFSNNLKKFIEWEAIAQRENANISRELPNSTINSLSIIWDTGYTRAEVSNGLNLSFRFDTDTPATKIANRPLLVIFSNKLITNSLYGQMVSIQVIINLTSSQAQNLFVGTEPDTIERRINEIRRTNSLFN